MSLPDDRLLAAMRQLTAELIWREEAVQVNVQKPFQLASGNYSPVYINCRRLISSVAFVDFFSSYARTITQAFQVQFEVFAGGETAGIPFAAFLAKAFGKPMVYVRKSTKAYGTQGSVEGKLKAGQRVLLVEDLITDAGSKVGFIKSLQSAGAVAEDVLVVLDRLQGGRESLQQHSVRLYSMADIEDLLRVSRETGALSSAELTEVSRYLGSPKAWHAERGLAFKEGSQP